MGKPKKQFSKTISKATSDSSNPPKEKHVRGIISFFFYMSHWSYGFFNFL